MPTYTPLRIKGASGLNTRLRSDQLAPGEAAVADNVEFRNLGTSKRRGYSRVLTGAKDSVIYGGPGGDSLSVLGDQYWVEHGVTGQTAPASNTAYREHGYHQRMGVISIPEGGQSFLRLDVESGDPDWALEMTLHSNDLNLRFQDPSSSPTYWEAPVVMTKSDGNTSNWAVRIVPDATDSTGDPKFRVVLTLYEGADHSITSDADPTTGTDLGTDFFYDDGGGNKSWIEPGKRYWFAWKFDDATPQITSYYWAEGDSTAVSSTQSVAGNLRINGVDDGNSHPIVIGRRPETTLESNVPAETGFNGTLGELRFYNGSADLPTWDSTYAYYETEVESESIAAGGAFLTTAADLALYWSFAQQYITATRFVDPRYSAFTAADNRAWLTGADATWVAGTGALGTQALAFVPSHSVAGEENTHNTVIGSVDANGWFHIHGGGIRVPFGNRYATTDDGTETSGFKHPTNMSWMTSVQVDNFSSATSDEMTLMGIYRVRQGVTNKWEYTVGTLFRIRIFWDGAQWVLSASQRHSGGLLTVSDTTAFPAGTPTMVGASVQFVGSGATRRLDLRLYRGGAQVATGSVASTDLPTMSTVTNTDTTGQNKNDDDGRDKLYPFFLGCGVFSSVGDPKRFMVGAQQTLGSDTAGDRRYWAFHNNESPFSENDGVGFRGDQALRGVMGGAWVWRKTLSEQEFARYSAGGPSVEQIVGYGSQLLSAWDFQEGKGDKLWDRGYLSNHLRFHPYPRVMPGVGAIKRRQKSPILGIWEVRTRTPREGVQGRDLYALAGGSVCAVAEDGSGNPYLTPISSRVLHHEKRMPSAFQSSDFFYICTGEGPVMRVSRDRVTVAGLSPALSGPDVQRHDNLGWVEADRDGTFEIDQKNAASSSETVFEFEKKYQYKVSYYDSEAALESVPTLPMVWTIANDPDGAKQLDLKNFPMPQEKSVSNIRIYRTTAGGGVFYFLAEIPVSQNNYSDTTDDNKLTSGSLSASGRNYPPPNNANIGVAFGARALYAGVPEAPGTLYISQQGLPEACPPEYQITLGRGRSNKITAILPFNDRAMVFFGDLVYAVTDQFTDLAPGELGTAPVAYEEVRDSVGCLTHHGIQVIDQMGAVFPGERGLHTTDGYAFQYASDRIERTWRTLDLSTAEGWHSQHHRRNDQYILFCSDGSVTDPVTSKKRNNIAIVWDYARDAFSVFRNLQAAYSYQVEDKATGENRIYFSDYLGNLWEFDSPDSPVDNDGGVTVSSGTTASGSTTTKVQLVGDSSLPTSGDGLRGVELTLGEGGSAVSSRILYNDANSVTVEAAFSAAPAQGIKWKLGRIVSQWDLGLLDFDDLTRIKKVAWVQYDFEPTTGSVVDAKVVMDEQAPQVFSRLPASATYARTPEVMGRCRRVQTGLSDELPDNYWECNDVTMAWHPKGRSSW